MRFVNQFFRHTSYIVLHLWSMQINVNNDLEQVWNSYTIDYAFIQSIISENYKGTKGQTDEISSIYR